MSRRTKITEYGAEVAVYPFLISEKCIRIRNKMKAVRTNCFFFSAFIHVPCDGDMDGVAFLRQIPVVGGIRVINAELTAGYMDAESSLRSVTGKMKRGVVDGRVAREGTVQAEPVLKQISLPFCLKQSEVSVQQ